MAAIVYLDVDDEITSAAARIRTLEDERIALVLPLGSRLATSRINFRLLAREAETRGRRIEIVTNDASARALAASAGLPTHLSVAAFEGGGVIVPPSSDPAGSVGGVRGDHRRAVTGDDSPTLVLPRIQPPAERLAPVPQVGPHPPRPRGPLVAVILLLIALVGAGGGAAVLLLPSAEIVLTPAMNTIGPLNLQITAQAGVTQPDPVNLLVPATRFTFDLEASDTFAATGLNVVETAASGEVTFENCDTGGAVTIPEGSVVSTGAGVKFRTLATVSLRKARLFPRQCDGANVAIEASEPGPEANVAAGLIDQIPDGYDQDTLRVLNLLPTAGGTHTETPFVQQADVDAALVSLNGAISTSFEEQLAAAAGVPQGTTVFPETKVLGVVTPSVDPATLIATEVAEFELGLAAQGSVLGVDPAPVRTLADARIRTAVSNGFRLGEASISIDVGEPAVVGATITFPVTISATEVRVVDVATLLARVRGLGLPQARTVLGEYGAVAITVWPDWVTTIPNDPGRAILTVTEPAAASASPGAPEASP